MCIMENQNKSEGTIDSFEMENPIESDTFVYPELYKPKSPKIKKINKKDVEKYAFNKVKKIIDDNFKINNNA